MTNRPVWTLPVKCSTLKRVDWIVGKIIVYELWITLFSYLLWSLSYNYMMVITRCLPDIVEHVVAILALTWISWTAIGYVLLVEYGDIIFNKVPRLECIKDEEV